MATPTDNPVAAYYPGPEGWPAWTDRIRWDAVIDMKGCAKGANDFERFENARDELALKGGGVLYYPAGTYDFRDMPTDGPGGRGLMLRRGVVIRGEAPAKDAVEPGKGRLALGTRFLFPFRRRAEVAVETGRRARIRLEGAIVTQDRRGNIGREDVFLSIGVVKGKIASLDPADVVISRRREPAAGGAEVTETPGGLDIALTLELESSPKGAFPFKVALRRDGDRFEGEFAGKVGDLDSAGRASGRIVDCAPEVPGEWNVVGLMPEKGGGIRDVDDVGIVWVHLVGAVVWFGPDVSWGTTWREGRSWKSMYVTDEWASRVPDGTHPMDPFCGGGNEYVGAGRGRLVMGCVFEQAAAINTSMNAGVKHSTAPAEAMGGFGPGGFHMQKFAARVGVHGREVLVAANVLPKSEGRNFKYRQRTIRTGGQKNDVCYYGMRESVILFDYAKSCGIDVNKDNLGMVRDQVKEPSSNAGYYEEGVVVRDNFVYNNGHKGFNVSGRWVAIAGNSNDRCVLRHGLDPYGLGGWRLTLDGFSEVSGGGGGPVSDTLSRAFDLCGQNLWVDGNWFTNTGSDGNDGEGILCQAHGGTQLFSWGVTRNRHEKGVGASGYIGGWGVRCVGCLIAWNETAGWVGQAGPPEETDCAYIGNTAGKASAGKGGTALTGPPATPPSAPADVTARPADGVAVMVAWRDASDSEIGFRVDRAIDGGAWRAIAYRPPRIQGSDLNPQAWKDFTAPPGRRLRYRVVALDAEDSDRAASAPTPELTLARVR